MSVDQLQKPIEIVLINIQMRCNLNDQIFLNQFYGVVPCYVPSAHTAQAVLSAAHTLQPLRALSNKQRKMSIEAAVH